MSDTPGSRFECQLDGGAFTACASPKSYTDLSRGTHTVYVRAIDPAGTVDPTPAVRQFTVGTTSGGGARAAGCGEARTGSDDHAQAGADHGERHGSAPRPLPEGPAQLPRETQAEATRKTVASRTFVVKAERAE